MIAIRGIYENGIIKLKKPININKPLNVIVTFIDEDIQIDYQLIKENKNTDDYNEHLTKLKEKYKDLPITWGDGKPDIQDLAGIWKDKKITLQQLRDKAWKRNL